MPTPTVAPYGSWQSPITSDLIVAATIGLSQATFDGDDIYWIEQRPTERGRNVIVRRTPDGNISDVNPAPFNARTRAHEYGGGSFVVADGVVYFSHFDNQRLYRQERSGVPQPLTPTGGTRARVSPLRYADAVIDRRRGRMIAVREDHTQNGEAVNALVSLDLEGDEQSGGQIVVSGNNFYSSPRISPESPSVPERRGGTRLAWLTWNHPNMPWDGTELWVGELDDRGAVTAPLRIAGGLDESIFQPEWSPDGVLHFVSDRTGWWNLYRWRGGQSEALCPKAAEFGEPQWVFGQSTYAFESATQIVCAYSAQGTSHLARLDTTTGALTDIPTPYTTIGNVRASRGRVASAGSGRVLFIGGSPTEPNSVVLLDLATNQHTVLRRASSLQVDAGYLSIPRAIEFPTTPTQPPRPPRTRSRPSSKVRSTEEETTAHAFYYPPTNKDFVAPLGERPPLLVKVHGGPTGSTSNVLNPTIQFWTSRGFAVLDVNYGGSTGYGTAYRRRLNGNWGIVDIDDTVNGARYCVAHGMADGNRLCIDGGSAGGYTTLAALTFRDVFKAGASYFGVSDLEALATDTHKFESRYLDSMIGPYPAQRDLYVARSPIHFTERLNVPLILFQGLEDKVVPPNQAEQMYEAVKRKGIPVAYIPYEGEQHGFRQAQNIKHALDSELYFYAKVFGFATADAIEPVPIENL